MQTFHLKDPRKSLKCSKCFCNFTILQNVKNAWKSFMTIKKSYVFLGIFSGIHKQRSSANRLCIVPILIYVYCLG